MARGRRRHLGTLSKELLEDMSRENHKLIRSIESNESVWVSECGDSRSSLKDQRFACMMARMTADARFKLEAVNRQLERRVDRGT